jgi:hypothetical protein
MDIGTGGVALLNVLSEWSNEIVFVVLLVAKTISGCVSVFSLDEDRDV